LDLPRDPEEAFAKRISDYPRFKNNKEEGEVGETVPAVDLNSSSVSQEESCVVYEPIKDEMKPTQPAQTKPALKDLKRMILEAKVGKCAKRVINLNPEIGTTTPIAVVLRNQSLQSNVSPVQLLREEDVAEEPLVQSANKKCAHIYVQNLIEKASAGVLDVGASVDRSVPFPNLLDHLEAPFEVQETPTKKLSTPEKTSAELQGIKGNDPKDGSQSVFKLPSQVSISSGPKRQFIITRFEKPGLLSGEAELLFGTTSHKPATIVAQPESQAIEITVRETDSVWFQLHNEGAMSDLRSFPAAELLEDIVRSGKKLISFKISDCCVGITIEGRVVT
jgi:hypothetical protein